MIKKMSMAFFVVAVCASHACAGQANQSCDCGDAGLSAFSNSASAEQISGFCTGVKDAATLLVATEERLYTVQLAYIVAPEPGQKFGAQAKQFVEKLALNQQLKILPVHHTSQTSITAEVYSPKKGDSINFLLAFNGFARPANDGGKRNPVELGFAFAKKHRRGVWSDPNMTPLMQNQRQQDSK